MNYQDYVELGLKDDGNLKLILKGTVENNGQNKIGVVSVVYITKDVEKAKQKLSPEIIWLIAGFFKSTNKRIIIIN